MRIEITSLVFLFATGCSSGGTGPMGTPDPGEPRTDAGGGAPAPDGSTVPPSDRPADCSALADGIYVATKTGYLVPFDPETASFGASRPLCPEVGGSAVAMSIDRRGHAWIAFTNGLLYDMDLASGACTVASDAPLPDRYWYWGSSSLSFVSDSEDSTSESLYYSYANDGPDSEVMGGCYRDGTADGYPACRSRVARVDTDSGAVAPLASILDAPYVGLALAGTGAGDSWGMAFAVPAEWSYDGRLPMATPTLVRLDKTTGAVLETQRIEELTGTYYNHWYGEELDSGGLAFWGGRFYLFLHAEGVTSSSIYRYDPATGAVDEIMRESGLSIADVGVSTCAPRELI